MKLPVFISRRARRDISGILAWIADRSAAGARQWLMTFEGTLTHLPREAASCALAPEAEDLGIELRHYFFKTRRGNVYRLIFTIRPEAIHILAVRGTGQDLVSSEDLDIPE